MILRIFLASLIILLLVQACPALSAETDSESDFGISLSLGIRPGGEELGHFWPSPNSNTRTIPVYSLGLHYRSISLPHNTRLIISTEVSYYDMDSDTAQNPYTGTSFQYIGYCVPILVWGELWPKGKFGPFVRLGIGAAWTDYKDVRSDGLYFEPHFQFWSFVYGAGGGVYYSPNERFDIILSIQGTVIIDDAVSTDDETEWERTLYGPWEIGFMGVTVRYWM